MSTSQCSAATALAGVILDIGDKEIVSSHLVGNGNNRCRSVRMGRRNGSSVSTGDRVSTGKIVTHQCSGTTGNLLGASALGRPIPWHVSVTKVAPGIRLQSMRWIASWPRQRFIFPLYRPCTFQGVGNWQADFLSYRQWAPRE